MTQKLQLLNTYRGDDICNSYDMDGFGQFLEMGTSKLGY